MLATMERLPFNNFPTSIPPSHSPPIASPRAGAAAYGPSAYGLPIPDRMHYAAPSRNPASVRAGASSNLPPAVQSPPPLYQSELVAEPATGPIYTSSSSVQAAGMLPSIAGDHEPGHPSGASLPSTTATVPTNSTSTSATTSASGQQSTFHSAIGENQLYVCMGMSLLHVSVWLGIVMFVHVLYRRSKFQQHAQMRSLPLPFRCTNSAHHTKHVYYA